nr:NADH-quinone oxidoreductase subunit H [uncultured Rhodopila sp.]
MSLLLSLVAQILHIALMIAAAPVVAGLADWLQVRLAGRPGASILLPWRDLVRLSRKTPAETDAGSSVLRFAPATALGVTIAAAALVPSFSRSMALTPLADLLVIVSLLAFARAAMVLAALDAGAAMPGLAAQQSSALAIPAEAALIIAVFAIALMAGGFNLDLIMGQMRDGGLAPAAATAVVLAALLLLAVADDGFALMGLEQAESGNGIAVARLTGWLRRLVWIDLIAALFLPFGFATAGSGPLEWSVGLACWGLKLAILIPCLSAARLIAGRVAAQRVPGLAAFAILLAALAAVMVLSSARLA